MFQIPTDCSQLLYERSFKLGAHLDVKGLCSTVGLILLGLTCEQQGSPESDPSVQGNTVQHGGYLLCKCTAWVHY